jgi:hypothetical protein
MPLARFPAVRPVPGDFPFGLPAPQRGRGPGGPAVVGLGLAGDGVAGAGAAEAVGFGVAEIAGGGRYPHDDLLGGRGDVAAGGVPCDRARASGGFADGLGGAVPPGPAGERILDEFVGRFFATRVFGPGRAELLAAQLPADPSDTAAAAMRARIRARFAELHTEREQIETQLRALEKTTPAADPTLLDQLPR